MKVHSLCHKTAQKPICSRSLFSVLFEFRAGSTINYIERLEINGQINSVAVQFGFYAIALNDGSDECKRPILSCAET